jgi:uncharacterized protein YeaO (DUF488 family)
MTFVIKRIYEPATDSDGMRVLVDRIWPQGISRFDAKIDVWDKDVAPTTDLRKWFGHRPERWTEFRKRYRAELARNPAVSALRKEGRGKTVTLLYAAKDKSHNHALVLVEVLNGRKKPPRTRHKSKRGASSSPVCYAGEADPAYMGYLDRKELAGFLNTMLAAERAGARVALRSAKDARTKKSARLWEMIQHSEAQWCALLQRALRALGTTPSRKTGTFYGKAMAIEDDRERLVFLNRGQEWVVRKLEATLPKIQDDGLHRDLTAMLRSHKANIHTVATAISGEPTRKRASPKRA